jgi:hypothetical protein
MPLLGVHVAQIAMPRGTARVALDPLLTGLCRLRQLPGYVFVVVDSGDTQPFSLAGMLPQLERLGVIFAGASYLTHGVVLGADCLISLGKIRVEFDAR